MDNLMICVMLLILSGVCHIDGATHLGPECLDALNPNVTTVYKTNLKTLLGSLVVNAPLQGGFFNTSVGNGSGRVYGLGWCRADASPITCSNCLNDSISTSFKECPESISLAIWSSLCNIRFSNNIFFGELWNSSSSSTYGNHGLDDPDVFTRGFSMMETLVRNVSKASQMYPTDVIDVGNNRERYGLGQCSQDLSESDCVKCLGELLTTYQTYVLNRTGWEMLGVSCGMWYDDFEFYDNDSRPNIPSPNPSGISVYFLRVNNFFFFFVIYSDNDCINSCDVGCGKRWYKKGDMILALVAILVLYNWIS
ncbi:antimicrobial ginkbilobin-2-like protein [Bidens hawaiensis]|uniref:antimicrobial ginkbilobin-2-like protein n=1 Tax=Bidens hawaiensis TaxID=980011 RepID=UPI00404A9643